jgi:hypothetical protein
VIPLEPVKEDCSKTVNPSSTSDVNRPKNVLQPTMCQARCREKEEHPLSCCPNYLSLSIGERWGFVLKRKLCQFCLGADHKHKQCDVESDYHHTLLRGENPVDYKPTYVQKGVAASASPRESVPVQLVVQQVHVQGGPDCRHV